MWVSCKNVCAGTTINQRMLVVRTGNKRKKRFILMKVSTHMGSGTYMQHKPTHGTWQRTPHTTTNSTTST